MTEIAFEDEVLRLVTHENCLLAVWCDAPSVPRLKELEKVATELGARWPAGTIFINAMVAGTPNFSAEAREEAARQMRKNVSRGVAKAHVVAVGGLSGITTRTFLSAVLLMGRSQVPTKVFSSIEEAAPWLLEHLDRTGGPGWTREELVSLYEQGTRRPPAARASTRR